MKISLSQKDKVELFYKFIIFPGGLIHWTKYSNLAQMKGRKCWNASKTLKMVPRHTWQSRNLHFARESPDVEWNAKKSLSLSLGQSLSNTSVHRDRLEGLLKHTLSGPIPRAFALVSLIWDLKFCISKKFPSDAGYSCCREDIRKTSIFHFLRQICEYLSVI